jgi:hypothetical protein
LENFPLEPLLPLLSLLAPRGALPGSMAGKTLGKRRWRMGRQQGRQAQMMPTLDSTIVQREEMISSPQARCYHALNLFIGLEYLQVVSGLEEEKSIVVILKLLVTTTLQCSLY